jgi:hypothetical protein
MLIVFYALLFFSAALVTVAITNYLWHKFRPLTDEEKKLFAIFLLALNEDPSKCEVQDWTNTEYRLYILDKNFIISERLGIILYRIKRKKSAMLEKAERAKDIDYLMSKFDKNEE